MPPAAHCSAIPTTHNVGRMRVFDLSSSSSSRCFDSSESELFLLHQQSDITTVATQPALCSSPSSSLSDASSSSSVGDQCDGQGPLPVFVAARVPFLAGGKGGEDRKYPSSPTAELDKPSLEREVAIQATAHSDVKNIVTAPYLHRVSSMGERVSSEEEVGEEQSNSVEKKRTKKKGGGGAFGFASENSNTCREEHDHLLQTNASTKRQKEKVKVKRVHRHMEGPSLEAAVRRALSINQKPSCCDTDPSRLHVNKEGSFLPKSSSVREYDHHLNHQKRSLHLPPTIILKRTISSSSKSMTLLESTDETPLHSDRHYKHHYPVAKSKVSVKGRRSPPLALSVGEQEGFTYKGLGKSPSEKRWEEAAEDEERKEKERRERRSTLQSHSMRYDRSHMVGYEEWDEGGGGEDDGEEWAVYKRSGIISVRPKEMREDMKGECKSIRVGGSSNRCRSWSMREGSSAPDWAAACGCGARLLCPCCCAAPAPPPPPHRKSRSAGFLGACRRLLGLAKKHPSPSFSPSSSQSPHFYIS